MTRPGGPTETSHPVFRILGDGEERGMRGSELRRRAMVRGAQAAVRSPAWLGGDRLRELLDGWRGAGESGPADEMARRWANRWLRVLARLPGSTWRNTCLY